MQFFQRQEQARSLSRRLLLLYALSFLATAAAVGIGFGVMLALVEVVFNVEMYRQPGVFFNSHTSVAVGTSLALAAFMAGAIWFCNRELKKGGSEVVAHWLGATRVPHDTQEPDRKRLLNVVEEMAIASGLPTPRVFVMEQQDSINALAAGTNRASACLMVTAGCLLALNRDELQAVVAHEFSHIINGDMQLNQRMIGPLFGLSAVVVLARKMLLGPQHDGRVDPQLHLYPIALPMYVLGGMGWYLSRYIKNSVLQQREFLADAGAVEYTRLADGMIGALIKVRAGDSGSLIRTANVERVSHMLFADGMPYGERMGTHPPVIERLQRIKPGFGSSDFIDSARAARRRLVEKMALPPRAEPSHSFDLSKPMGVSSLASSVGHGSLDLAAQIRASLPDRLTQAAHDPELAPALILAVLAATAKSESVVAQLDARLASQVQELLPDARSLKPMQRLPLVHTAIPVGLTNAGASKVQAAIDTLMDADAQVTLFEYAMAKLIRHHLEVAASPRNGTAKLRDSKREVADLLAVLALMGHSGSDAVRHAFNRGIHLAFPINPAAYRRPAPWIDAMDQALDKLARLDPFSKELLLEAMLATSRHDDQITVEEAEILRMICGVLECPLPPLLDKVASESP